MCVAVLVRVGPVMTVLHTPGFEWRWGGELAAIASSLAAGHGFSSPYGGNTGPTAQSMPLYPVLLATLLRIAGPARASQFALFLNILSSSLVCLPLAIVGRRLAVGLGAAWAWALAPLAGFTEARFFWSTSLYTLALTSLLAWTITLDRSQPTRRFLLYGLSAGAMTLLYAAHWATLVVVLIMLVMVRRVSPAQCACVFAAIVVVVTPWMIRNSIVFGRPSFLQSNGGYELYRSVSTPPADPSLIQTMNPLRNPAEHMRYATMGEAAYMSEERSRAVAFIKANRTLVAERIAARAVLFWWGSDEIVSLSRWKIAGWAHVLFMIPPIGGFVGLIVLWRGGVNRIALLSLACFLTVFSLQYSIAISEPRYRAPIEPMLWALTAGVFRATSIAGACDR